MTEPTEEQIYEEILQLRKQKSIMVEKPIPKYKTWQVVALTILCILFLFHIYFLIKFS